MRTYIKHLPLALLAAAVGLAACEWRPSGGHVGDADSCRFAYCTVEYEDSFSNGHAMAYQQLQADFPADDDSSAVAQSVLAWLCCEVRDRCFPNYDNVAIDSAFAVTGEATSFAEDVLATYGRKGLQHMADELNGEAYDGYAGGFGNYLTIDLAEQAPDYLTFELEHDIYTGGAHGSQFHQGQTFRTSDGALFSWKHFDPAKRAELTAQLKKGLMAYFNQYEEEKISTDSALFERLMLWDDPDTPENELEFGLPLPATNPWITRNGIVFIYQEYEVAAYAMGRPTAVVPAKSIIDCLTDEGRQFINFK